jgi:carbonic anhydrase/acetyltransferase-like protein (isoleucine patch superfamily)
MEEKVRVHETVYVAPNATLLGNVSVGEQASIWFGCVVRSESAPITIGPRTNVQDLSVLHADPGFPCRLGAGVTIGHRAVIHGATVEDGAMIGIGAILLNGCVVGEEAIVGAGSVVTDGAEIPPRTLALGVPARVVRDLREDELTRIRAASVWYVEHARHFRELEDEDGKSDQLSSP